MIRKDKRIKLMNEILNGIRVGFHHSLLSHVYDDVRGGVCCCRVWENEEHSCTCAAKHFWVEMCQSLGKYVENCDLVLQAYFKAQSPIDNQMLLALG